MTTPTPHIFDLDRETLHQLVTEWGLAPYRADQVLHWVYRRHTADFHQMLNLSLSDRQILAQRLQTTTGEIIHHQLATDGVQKLLLQWGNETDNLQSIDSDKTRQSECVMIPSVPPAASRNDNTDTHHRERRTACISSQIGCPVGCTFCASGLGGAGRQPHSRTDCGTSLATRHTPRR